MSEKHVILAYFVSSLCRFLGCLGVIPVMNPFLCEDTRKMRCVYILYTQLQ